MLRKYKLNEDGRPVYEPSWIKWARWYQIANRHVMDQRIGAARVSTVFLGIDHNFTGATPVLWETMVFGGQLHLELDRCSGSREQAEPMHAQMVKRVLDVERPAQKNKIEN
jgi:hypothetical protein